MFRAHPTTARRRGVTLIELLFVVSLMVLLMSIALPLLQLNYQDKKLREAARQLNAQFASAKAMAGERGRPVGVWFDRPLDRVNECIQVYLAEMPLPYSGDVQNARCYVRRNPNLPSPYAGFWQVVFDQGFCGSLTGSRTLVGIGTNDTFLIRFNYRGSYFLVKRVPTQNNNPPAGTDVFVVLNMNTAQAPLGCWLTFDKNSGTPMNDLGWGKPGTDDDGNNVVDDIGEMGWPDPSLNATAPNDTHDWPVGLPFQVFLNPRKLSAQPLDMPSGVAVDLAYSGFGALGTEFDAWRISNALPDSSSVVVMFAPGGQIERVYSGGAFVEPLAPLNFLIGKSEQIQTLSSTTNSPNINPRAADGNIANGLALWISVGQSNGTVTTAENYWDPNNPTIDVCRRFARAAQTKGGGP